MQTVEEIIETQFEQLVKVFKPQFGNMDHIQIVKQLDEIKRLETMLEKPMSTRRAEAAMEEMKRLKRNTLYLLKR